MSETTVGSIVGYLRLSADEFHREMERAIAEADALNGKKVDVKITSSGADRVASSTKQASASMDEATLSARRLAEANERVKVAQVRLTEAQDAASPKASTMLKARYDLNHALRDEQDAIFRTYDANVKLASSEEKVEQATSRAEKATKKATDANKQQSQGLGLLVTAIAAVGPAVVPLAAATVGLAAGFGAMGAAGIAALVGIKHEMDTGTRTGLTYSAGLKTLKGDMNALGTVAAKGVLAPFQSVVRDLQSKMPALTGMVRDFSTVTGKTAANLTVGLVAAFIALEPLMRDVATYTFDLSQRFEHLMTGPGVKSFGEYVRSVFPQVMATVESLVEAAVRLVTAFEPLGMGVLSEIKLLSDLLNGIPLNVLSELATLATSAFLGFKGFSIINGMTEGLGRALKTLGASEATAAAGMTTLSIAAGGIGIALAAVTFIMSQHAEKARLAQQAVNDYTDALRQSNGVIDQNVRSTTAKMLADSGALQLANELHVSLMDVTSAALGQKDALGWVNAQIDKQRTSMLAQHQSILDVTSATNSQAQAFGGVTGALNVQQSSLRKQVDGTGAAGQALTSYNNKAASLLSMIGQNNTAFKGATQNFKDQKDAMTGATGAAAAQAIAQQNLATHMGTTVTALQAAQTAQSQQTTSALAATTQMQLENDAAGLLKQSLDALNGKALSAADAQNAFDTSLANMGDHVTATGTKIHFTTTSIADMSAASVSLRGQLNSQVHNLEGVIEANGGLANSTAGARAQMKTMRQQIIDNAVAHGVDRQAVTDYIDKLLAIPKKIPPTQLDVNNAAAMIKIHAMQTALNNLTGKTVDIYTNEYINKLDTPTANSARTANQYALGNVYSNGTRNVATGQKPAMRAMGGDVPGYAGGTLIGPGSGTSDSIMAMVAQTSQLVRLSTGEFISTSASRAKNRAALEAGNKGAQLQVAGQSGPQQTFIIQPTDPYLVAAEVARHAAFAAV